MATVSFHKGITFNPTLSQQILSFVTKLGKDPSQPSLHVEPIHAAKDKRVRTGRVNDQFRAVMFELQGKDDTQFIVLDILNHDDAYRLASTATLRLNPVSGIMEVSTTPAENQISRAEIESRAKQLAAEMAAKQQAAAQAESGAASRSDTPASATGAAPERTPAEKLSSQGITREDLVENLGISLESAEIVWAAATEDAALEALGVNGRSWETDAVTGLLAGMSLEEVKEDLQLQRPDEAPADADDDDALITALHNPRNSAEFTVAPGEEELAELLASGSFNDWRTFLHPSQLSVVETRFSGSGRVLGGAGTGKTVVVIHRTNFLLKEYPHSRILLTTYTRKLANSLKSQLNLLNPSFEEASMPGMPGLWINGIDSVVWSVIKNANRVERPEAIAQALGGTPARDTWTAMRGNQEERAWEGALDVINHDVLGPEKRNTTFLSQEYKAIVLGQGITTEREYLRARRPGRGTSLGRHERKEVWRAMHLFVRTCLDRGTYTYPQLAAIAAEILTTRGMPLFDHVLIDEAQDFHPAHWRFLRAATAEGPDDIFLAEDSHQRIYGQHLTLSHYGITTRGRSAIRLKVNYRTTAQNLRYASAILDGEDWVDSTDTADTLTGYRSIRRGPEPTILHATDRVDEAHQIARYLQEWVRQPEVSIGILCRSLRRCEEIAAQLGEEGIEVNTLHDANSTADHPVNVLTMHNAKGLEFTHVVLLGVGRDSLPPRYQITGLAAAEKADALQRERALLYVAASRARDQLLVSIIGEPSELLPAEERA